MLDGSVVCVLKFGGTSVANVQRIRRVASLVADRYLRKGEKVAVVVSAMAGMTDQLSRYLEEMSLERTAEDDLVLSAGESITTALLSKALTELGHPARSFLGWQLPIVTDDLARRARILQVTIGNLLSCFDANVVPVVAGFQGVTEQGRMTTLGRGGSDTTAVALAAALDAERCDIFTDVEGVYTADPRLVPSARMWSTLPVQWMLEMASAGAKVLQTRAVEIALKHQVPVRVLSSFVEGRGTLVLPEVKMEKYALTGLIQQKNVVKVGVKTPSSLEVLTRLWEADEPIEVLTKDFATQAPDLTCLVEVPGLPTVIKVLDNLQEGGEVESYEVDHDVARVSLMGAAIGWRSEILSAVKKTLKEQNISLLAISISTLRLDLVVEKHQADLAVLTLHSALESYLAVG